MAKIGFTFGTAFALTAALLLASPAYAADPSAGPPAPIALELSEDARESYDQGNYERALLLFSEAYEREPDPNLLFNIARCHEKLGQVDAALEKYDAFLASPNADPEGRDKAEASRAELVRARDRLRVDEKERASAAKGDADAPPRAGSSGMSSSLTPWLLLGAGVAALGSGVVVYSLGVSDHHEVENQAGYDDPSRVAPMTQRDAEARVESGKEKKLVGGILLGGGGALLASSVLLFVLDRDEPSTKVGFDVSPRGASMAIRGRF
jgi:tetratricopeptide (TPR) repeat protein